MKKESTASKIVNLADVAFKRDEKKAGLEMTEYFVEKHRQIKGAQLVSAIQSSLRKKTFSGTEAQKLTEFLSRTFDIRGPAIQYAQAGYLKPGSSMLQEDKRTHKKKKLFQKVSSGNDFFHQLFLRLQVAVQENLLDYNGARVLVREIVTSYPTTRESLRR